MRTRWKQAGLIALSTLAVGLAVVAGLLLLRNYPSSLMVNPSQFEGQLDLAAVSLLAYLVAVKWIERRVPTEFSLQHALRVLAAGTLAGIALLCARDGDSLGGRHLSAGRMGKSQQSGARIRVHAGGRGVRGSLVPRTAVPAVLQSCRDVGSSAAERDAVCRHARDQSGATLTGLLNVALAGVLLGAAYAATGRLWLPIGLHLGWNFAEGPIFGTAVSGTDIGPSLIVGDLEGPVILTGGEFGPEASIVGVAVVLAAARYLLWRIVKLKCAEPPIWRDAKPPILSKLAVAACCLARQTCADCQADGVDSQLKRLVEMDDIGCPATRRA